MENGKSIKLSHPGELLQKRDGNHPLTDVALDIYDHYGLGWSQAEDLAIRVHESMTKRGWTVNPPNVGGEARGT